jgi:diaminopimelate decarboxylase
MPKNINLSLEQLENIAFLYGSPFHIYDEKMIRDNIKNFLNVFRSEFSSFRQFYAVKALPNPAILKILLEEGLGFDCSSPSELYICKQIGATGDNIMYTSNYTPKEDIDNAINNDVILNLDDIDALEYCDPQQQNLICFRLNPSIGKTDSETKSNVLGGKNTKFGINSDLIVNAYRQAKEMGFTRFGIHCMSGSNVMDPNYWYELVNVIYETINQLYTELDIKVEFMNVGGGLGIPYQPNIPDLDISVVAKNIRKAIDENKSKYNLTFEPHLYMENGRYITGPYGWLVSRCRSIKQNEQIFYGLDACMAHLMRPGMYGAYHHITIPRLQKNINDVTETQKVNVVGSLCENNDWFARERELPIDIQKGDLFVIHSSGAHAQSMGFSYNGKLKCPELLLKPDGNVTMIRKPETYENLFGNCIF